MNSTGLANDFHEFVNQLQKEEQQQQEQQEQQKQQKQQKQQQELAGIGQDCKDRKDRKDRNEKTESLPTPDYSSDSAGSHESLNNCIQVTDAQSIPEGGHDECDTLSNARSDTTGNFLLVRRNDVPNGSNNWWQQKFYSSPTHTVDSGYDDNSVHVRRQQPVLCQVFAEEDVVEVDEDQFESSHSDQDAEDDDDGIAYFIQSNISITNVTCCRKKKCMYVFEIF